MNEKPDLAGLQMRAFAERRLAEAREAYDCSLVVGEEMVNRWDDLSTRMMCDGREISLKLMTVSDVNIRAVFDLAGTLVQAQSLQEAQSLQYAFLHDQAERVITQMKEMEALMSRQLKAYSDTIKRRVRA